MSKTITEEENANVEEAQIKLKTFLSNAKTLGMSDDEIFKKISALDIDKSWKYPYNCRKIFLFSFSVVFLFIVYYFDLHRALINVYCDWKHQTVNPNQCAVAMPDSFNRIFRPPVDCSLCNSVNGVDKVSDLATTVFEERYAYSGRPVVVMDGAVNWTAPGVFSFNFFRALYKDRLTSWDSQCQFFPYQTKFRHLGEFLNLTPEELAANSPWYVGWSNCDVDITNVLRQHYHRPYFLPNNAEGKRLDWIFMGSTGFGAPMHVDNVEYPSWQAQLRGQKKWILQPPPECFYQCKTLEVTVEPGEIIVLDTNQWYHQTLIVSEEISITIGAEFD